MLEEFIKGEALKAAKEMINSGLTIIVWKEGSGNYFHFTDEVIRGKTGYFNDKINVGYIEFGNSGTISTTYEYVPSKENGTGAHHKTFWLHDVVNYTKLAKEVLNFNPYEITRNTHRNYKSVDDFLKNQIFKKEYLVFKKDS